MKGEVVHGSGVRKVYFGGFGHVGGAKLKKN